MDGNFWLLVAATVVAGFYSANASLYRFAGPELVAPAFKEKALSLVMAGGVAGAFIGPNLASATRNGLSVEFAGAYVALTVVALIGLAVLSFIRFPDHQPPLPGAPAGRPLAEIARQPAFLTGHLIKRFGALPIMAIGALLNFACVAVALSGVDLMQFLVARFVLGVGWNFLYTGGSTLLTATYRPEEKTRAQGAMDFCVFATMALTSFASGALVTTQGWMWLNLGSLVPITLVSAALLWLALVPRAPAPAESAG